MIRTLVALSLMLGLSACDSDSSDTTENQTLQLTLSSLEALTNGFHYEGWAIIDGNPVSTGKFNVDADGRLVEVNGAAIANNTFDTGRDLSTAGAIVVTIEPTGDTDAVPAATKYLGGDLNSGQATLTVAHGSSLGDDFTTATGFFILATPTDGPDSFETSGLCFSIPRQVPPRPGLICLRCPRAGSMKAGR